ncbi:class I SAM-dependent methyltransferase [Nonomuraea candida]|uniref:class I SAM-dependent methyltransferase n=1 Tax=Nonomuraea candida TaxID=359159 RepID=UPI0005B91582|nr:methyltransferase domain-containing protein [Nonomuraea candida]
MPPAVTDRIAYWDRYALGIRKNHDTAEEALKDAFGWTQYSGHGPGDELLGDPATALELGCSRGHAVAALATKGISATGVDLSPVQVDGARQQWGHLPNAHSIFGALWFTDPEQWMPLVHQRLAAGGRLAFSCAPAVPGSYGIQGMYGAGFTGPRTWIYRWAYEPETWAQMLVEHGFRDVDARVEPAPDPANVGTLLVVASR